MKIIWLTAMSTPDSARRERDRVRRHTSKKQRRAVDRSIDSRVRACAGASDEMLERRIRNLEGEWDMERVLETNASALALTGVVLGAFVDRRWLWLSGAVATFLLQHAVQGWCPPVPVFRRFGIRTRNEIDTEKYALKAMRGDFRRVEESEDARKRALHALRAARNGHG